MEEIKKIAEEAKKPAGKDNAGKKATNRKVSTPKGKSKMAIKEKADKGDKKDLSKTLTTKNSKRNVKSLDTKYIKKR